MRTWRLIGADGKAYLSEVPGALGGHRRSRIYGLLDCPAALRAIARGGYVRDRVFFLNEEDARGAGYRPCAICLPQAYQAWKVDNRWRRMGMRKAQLVEKMERAWGELKDSYDGLPAERLVEAGVVGDWSVKDVLAHVTTWEEEALTHLPHILAGETPPRYSVTYGGVDAFNALMTERKRELSLAEVLRQLDETHARVMAYVREAPEELLTKETRFRRRIRLDTYGHYRGHAQMIGAWRAQA